MGAAVARFAPPPVSFSPAPYSESFAADVGFTERESLANALDMVQEAV
jgi:hypothetical protein